jgi:tetratricopeptide (TPR) repeat protein
LRNKEPERAIEMLQGLVGRSSGNTSAAAVEARGLLATIYGWIGRDEEARQVLTEARLLYPLDNTHLSHDLPRLLLSYGLDDRAEELLNLIDQHRDGPIRVLGARIDVALAREEFDAAHGAVEAALTDYHWAYGTRRWMTWKAWKEPLGAALGLAVVAGPTREDRWAQRDFNPDIADQWHAYIDLFGGRAENTSAFVKVRDDDAIDISIWGWRSQPKALASYLENDVEQAWNIIAESGDRGSGVPALSLLALAEAADPQTTDDWIETLRASYDDLPGWMPRSTLERFISGELTESEIDRYTPFTESRYYYLDGRPRWELKTSLDLGAYFLATGDTEKARDYLQRAVDTDLRYETDWLLAKHALDNLEAR